MSEIIVDYVEADRRVKAVEDLLKRAKAERDRLEAAVLEGMAVSTCRSYTAAGATAFLKRSLRVSLKPTGSKYDVRNAFAACKALDLLREQVNAQQLSSFVRGEVEAGRELHPSLLAVINIFEDFSVEVRKKA